MTQDDLAAQLAAGLPAVALTSYASTLTSVGAPTTVSYRSGATVTKDAQNNVVVAGTLAPPGVLGAGGAAQLLFTPSGTLRMTLWLDSTWRIGQAFPVARGSALDGLMPRAGAALVIATGPASDPRPGATGTVAAGLTFLGGFDPASPALQPFSWLSPALAPASDGPIGYDAGGALTMRLPLATASTALLGSGKTLALTLTAFAATDPVSGLSTSGLRLDTTLALPPAIELATVVRDLPPSLLDLTLTSDAFALPAAAALAPYLGTGADVAGALPAGAVATVEAIVFGIGASSRTLEYVGLELGVGDGYQWTLGPVSVTGPRFSFFAFGPLSGTPSYTASFAATLTLGTIAPILIAGQTGEVTVLSGRLDDRVPPPALTTLVQNLFGRTNNLPPTLVLEDIAFSADLTNNLQSAAIEIGGEWTFPFGWDGQLTLRDLRVQYAAAAGAPSGGLVARFAMGAADFTVTLALTRTTTAFSGEWSAVGAERRSTTRTSRSRSASTVCRTCPPGST